MVSTGENSNLVRQYLIHQSVLLINAPRPAACQFVLEWFRLAQAGKRIALGVSCETNDANRLSAILFCPPCQVIKR